MIVSRDGSKLLENCISKIPAIEDEELRMILSKVISLPPLRNQVSTDVIFFSDALTNKFGNYVIQRAYEKSTQEQKSKILQNIKLTL